MKITLIFLLISSYCLGQVGDTTKSLKSNVEWFIDTTKSIDRHKDIIPYYVYVLYISSNEKGSGNDLCFTLGYIVQSSEYTSINAQYYYRVNEDIVLVRFQEGIKIDPDLFKGIDLKIIDVNNRRIGKHDLAKIVQKLYPSHASILMARTQCALFCNFDSGFESTYYSNSDEIPVNKSIYFETVTDGAIEYKGNVKEMR